MSSVEVPIPGASLDPSLTEPRMRPEVLAEIQLWILERFQRAERAKKIPEIPARDVLPDGRPSASRRPLLVLAAVTSESLDYPEGHRLDRKSTKPSIAFVIEKATEVLEIEPDDLVGQKRTSEITLARQVAMFVAFEEADTSSLFGPQSGPSASKGYKVISRAFNKHHTTVMNAVENISRRLGNGESPVVNRVGLLRAALKDTPENHELESTELVHWVVLSPEGLFACPTFVPTEGERPATGEGVGVLWADRVGMADDQLAWEHYLPDIQRALFAE